MVNVLCWMGWISIPETFPRNSVLKCSLKSTLKFTYYFRTSKEKCVLVDVLYY
jgi:hypothetical protein